MRAKAGPKDLYVGMAAMLLGGILLFLAMRARWNPGDMLPGVEGTLTASVMAIVLLLLHPIPYARAMLYSLPVVAIEYWACAATGGPAVGIVGLQLLVSGFLGLVLGSRGAAAVPEPREVPSAAEPDHS